MTRPRGPRGTPLPSRWLELGHASQSPERKVRSWDSYPESPCSPWKTLLLRRTDGLDVEGQAAVLPVAFLDSLSSWVSMARGQILGIWGRPLRASLLRYLLKAIFFIMILPLVGCPGSSPGRPFSPSPALSPPPFPSPAPLPPQDTEMESGNVLLACFSTRLQKYFWKIMAIPLRSQITL